MSLTSVCVFCGANAGTDPAYTEAAKALGRALAERHLTLVYGGGAVGLMGLVADAALAAGGEVIGIIPQSLMDKEIGHKSLTRLEVVDGMHARKARMAELSDAFIALPGGLGTLEELFEVWTWGQLGYHGKPLGLLEVNGFYSKLTAFLDHIVGEGFVRAPHRDMLQVSESPKPCSTPSISGSRPSRPSGSTKNPANRQAPIQGRIRAAQPHLRPQRIAHGQTQLLLRQTSTRPGKGTEEEEKLQRKKQMAEEAALNPDGEVATDNDDDVDAPKDQAPDA